MRIVAWFSCGTASAVTAKLVLAKYGAKHDVVIARCIVPEEHPDNDRFAADCEAWFGRPVLALCSAEYASCEDVWTRRRYMSGVGVAPCSLEMKRAVRWQFEKDWAPDAQAFGYTVEEAGRVARFRVGNPDVRLLTPLIDQGLTKADCHAMVDRAGLRIPEMYRLGFPNANCIGCVAAQSPTYWNLVRRQFPQVFAQRAALSRSLGVRLVKLGDGERERLFLDELDPELGAGERLPDMECSLLCVIAEQHIQEGV